MRLRISTVRDRIFNAANNQPFEMNRLHPLPGFPDHTFSVVIKPAENWDTSYFDIRIFKGETLVQQACVYRLSAVAGTNPRSGAPIQTPYFVELDPSQQIFPLEDMVTELLKYGIPARSISLMHDEMLTTLHRTNGTDWMVTDGELICGPITSEILLPDTTLSEVTKATWAISYDGPDVGRVYLWPAAADKVTTVKATIARIRMNTALTA